MFPSPIFNYCGKLSFSGVSRNPSPGEKVDSKTTGTGGFEDGSGMRAVMLDAVRRNRLSKM